MVSLCFIGLMTLEIPVVPTNPDKASSTVRRLAVSKFACQPNGFDWSVWGVGSLSRFLIATVDDLTFLSLQDPHMP